MATIKFTLDTDNPPETSQEDLDRYDALRDENIDCSDIPELTEEFWANAQKPSRKPKQQ